MTEEGERAETPTHLIAEMRAGPEVVGDPGC